MNLKVKHGLYFMRTQQKDFDLLFVFLVRTRFEHYYIGGG